MAAEVVLGAAGLAELARVGVGVAAAAASAAFLAAKAAVFSEMALARGVMVGFLEAAAPSSATSPVAPSATRLRFFAAAP